MTILALDMGGTYIKAARVNDDDTVHEFREIPSRAKLGGKIFVETALQLCKTYRDYDKIGISVTGQVDSVNGTIIFANENVPDFSGTMLRRIFEDELKRPVVVENDVNSAAVAEFFIGANAAYDSCICLTYGTGIGGAIIIDQKLFTGSKGCAGEMGHMITHANGADCACGQRGCYECYASTTALSQNAQRIVPGLNNGRDILEMAEHNGSVAKLLSDWIDEVCYGLTTIIHIFQPDAVILGGGVFENESLLVRVESRLQTMLIPSFRDTKIMSAKLGNKAGLMGAAYLARRI